MNKEIGQKAFVKNAADPKQVKNAIGKEELRRENELNDLRTVLSEACGRRMMWRLLEECRVFSSTFDPNNSMQSFLNGKREIGHFLMAEIVAADEELLFKMMKENKQGDN